MTNILFITVDSLRADYIFGPNAPDSLETIPRLARDGLRFSTAYADAPYTKQSFLSIMSGTHPWMFNANRDGYESDRPHVAEILSEAGYSTGGFHTNTYLSPTYNYDRGFEYYMGRDTENAVGSRFETLYSGLVERAVTVGGVSDVIHQVYKSAGKHLGVQLGSSLYKPASELNDAIVDWTARTSQPAFVWAHYMDVHNPYYPHEGTVSEGISRRKAVQLFHRVNELRGDASQGDLDTLERLYRGEIEYLDRELGDLFDRLDGTLGLDDTLIVFTSDHGEAFNEKGPVFHPGSALYDENTHIPMIINGPDIEVADIETPVTNADLVPTMLSAVGIEPPESVVGEDLRTFAEEPPDRRFVFTESFSPEDGNAMVTDGRFKLVRDIETGEQSVFDRSEQPREVTDRSEQYPDVRRELAAELDDHIASLRESDTQDTEIEVTEDVRLQLRKLGYDE